MPSGPTTASSIWLEGRDTGTGADCAFFSTQLGPTSTASSSTTLPSNTQFDVDEHVAPADQFAAHVDPRRIGQAHPCSISRIGIASLRNALQFGKLHLAVDAEHFPFAFGLAVRTGKPSATAIRRYRSGSTLLRVVIGQATQPFGQPCRRHGHDAGVDLTNGSLFGCRVLLLDDAHDLPAALRTMRP